MTLPLNGTAASFSVACACVQAANQDLCFRNIRAFFYCQTIVNTAVSPCCLAAGSQKNNVNLHMPSQLSTTIEPFEPCSCSCPGLRIAKLTEGMELTGTPCWPSCLLLYVWRIRLSQQARVCDRLMNRCCPSFCISTMCLQGRSVAPGWQEAG